MIRFIGHITIILVAATPAEARQRLHFLARHLNDTCPDIEFADHNGDVDDYGAAEAECKASLDDAVAGVARFDNYEITPCRRFEEPDQPGQHYFECCEPEDADTWSLYGHIPGQGVECIADFQTREHAEEVYARITGTPYNTQAQGARP
ncbi:MAG: hypothetical protein SFV23_16940 [Planctomycetaceae bacterium]|nr:hypothetical protein [Planctomycetaceae bacterium]